MVAPHPASLQGRGAAGMALVLPAGSPGPPTPFGIECVLSLVLVWLCLGVTASLAIQSRSAPAPEDGEAPALLPDSGHLPNTHRAGHAGSSLWLPAPSPDQVGCRAAAALPGQRLLLCCGPAAQNSRFSKRKACQLPLPVPAPALGQSYPALLPPATAARGGASGERPNPAGLSFGEAAVQLAGHGPGVCIQHH